MNWIKNFLKARWNYKMNENVVMVFGCGIAAMSMGCTLFMLGLTYGEVRGCTDMVVAGTIAFIGFIMLAIVSYKINKSREKIN